MRAENWRDARSTGRKAGRRVLERLGIPKACASCGVSENDGRIIDVNHKNKNIKDNDPVNLEWLCRSCHALIDRSTARGVSTKQNEFGY